MKIRFDYDYDFLENRDIVDNIMAIQHAYADADLENIVIYSAKEEDLNYVIRRYLSTLYGKDLRQQYNNYLRKSFLCLDSDFACFQVCGKNNNRLIAHIPPLTSIDNASAIVHEFTHFYLYSSFSKKIKYLYNVEILSIFNQYFFSKVCDQVFAFKQNDLLLNQLLERVFDDLSNVIIDEYGNFSADKEEMTYFQSSVFANRLMQLCLEDTQKFLKQYREIFGGNRTLEDILKYYNISWTDDDTIDCSVKLIRKLEKKKGEKCSVL